MGGPGPVAHDLMMPKCLGDKESLTLGAAVLRRTAQKPGALTKLARLFVGTMPLFMDAEYHVNYGQGSHTYIHIYIHIYIYICKYTYFCIYNPFISGFDHGSCHRSSFGLVGTPCSELLSGQS